MEVEIGRVTHYYGHICVAVLKLENALKLGDVVHITGHTTNFIQRINSLEVEHHSVVWVKPGDHVALKVIAPVREHDVVYRILEDVTEPEFA